MTKKYNQNINDFTEPYYINGLAGRCLIANSRTTKQKQILFVHDLLDSLENSWNLINDLRSFGTVSSVDLPGLNDMKSFKSIGYAIDFDNYADYLATFVKLRFKRGKIIMVGKGLGFSIITRMLQKYPEIRKRVTTVASINGYVHHDDFILNNKYADIYRALCHLLSIKTVAHVYSRCISNSHVWNKLDSINPRYKFLFYGILNDKANSSSTRILFRNCDPVTRIKLIEQILELDNCQSRLNIKVLHAYSKSELINISVQRQHLQIAYKDYREYEIVESSNLQKNNNSIILPKAMRRALANAKA